MFDYPSHTGVLTCNREDEFELIITDVSQNQQNSLLVLLEMLNCPDLLGAFHFWGVLNYVEWNTVYLGRNAVYVGQNTVYVGQNAVHVGQKYVFLNLLVIDGKKEPTSKVG